MLILTVTAPIFGPSAPTISHRSTPATASSSVTLSPATRTSITRNGPTERRRDFFNSTSACSVYAAAHKQLALIFGFDVDFSFVGGRVLVYTDAGLLKDQQLVYGDNQFLLEIESLDLGFYIYFIHAGGFWFFRGLSGYVV
jgi:hypothetical protein